MINSKKKGNRGENLFAQFLVKNGIKAWRDSASGGGMNEKADIGNNLNLHFEVKTVKRINLLQVWKKCLVECQKTHNIPVIVTHFDNMPENEWLMTISSQYFLELLQGESAPVDMTYEDPRKKYEVKNAIEALKRVLKHYE